jgi:Transposase DDE domain
MHVTRIITTLLSKSIHKTRVDTLLVVVRAIIFSKQLNLTALGRSLDTPGKERSNIRRMDRLLSNRFYQNNSIDLYKEIIRFAVGNQGRSVIVVDWSGVPNSKRTAEDGEHCLLRASMIACGRSITLYEEVHPKKKEGNHKVHTSFLATLKSLLPETCRPYIVTDAGFKNPWFRAVSRLNWDYIGRVRGAVHYDDGSGFKSVRVLFSEARSEPKHAGKFKLSKKEPLETNFYLYRHKLVGRKKITKSGKVDRQKDSVNYGKSYREPWILVSSSSGFSAINRVIRIYKARMTIESSFRDTKSTEFGFSMNENKTIRAERYIFWFVLAAIASLVAWIVGFAAEKNRLHYDFQANSYKHRRVLSFFYLGCQIIKKKIYLLFDLEEIRREAWDEVAWNVVF